MKIGSEEVNGPASPVWQSLKGLSSRDSGEASTSNPQSPSSSIHEGPSQESSVACSTGSSVNNYVPKRGSIKSLDCEAPDFNEITSETPSTVATKDLEDQKTTCDSQHPGNLSSSTTSTSLSNPVNHGNNEVTLCRNNNGMKESHLAKLAAKEPQTFK